jgi:hypothetical protein
MEKFNSIHNHDARLGYSKEEDYFNRINRSLIDRQKAQVICPVCKSRTVAAPRLGEAAHAYLKCAAISLKKK